MRSGRRGGSQQSRSGGWPEAFRGSPEKADEGIVLACRISVGTAMRWTTRAAGGAIVVIVGAVEAPVAGEIFSSNSRMERIGPMPVELDKCSGNSRALRRKRAIRPRRKLHS